MTGWAKIGKKHPEARDLCTAFLACGEEDFRKNDPTLNLGLVLGLVKHHGVESASLIERHFATGRVGESLTMDLEYAKVVLGLNTARNKPKRGGASALSSRPIAPQAPSVP